MKLVVAELVNEISTFSGAPKLLTLFGRDRYRSLSQVIILVDIISLNLILML
jgi:hypothetical protein